MSLTESDSESASEIAAVPSESALEGGGAKKKKKKKKKKK